MEVDSNLSVKVWDLISQFVCWEFCRKCERLFPVSPKECQTDLLTFFKDMVIQMTTRHQESDITKYEVVAKFIEELNMLSDVEHLKLALQLGQTVKKICPELLDITNDLLKNIKEKFKMSLDDGDIFEKDSEFCVWIQQFSVEACKLLPVPDLVTVCENWYTLQAQTNYAINPDSVLERLRQEVVPEEVPQILDVIESGDVYRLCINGEGDNCNALDESLLEDFDERQKRQGMSPSPTKDNSWQSSEFQDCVSVCSRYGPVGDNNDHDRTQPAPQPFCNIKSHLETRECCVMLVDIFKKYDLKVPYSAQNLEKLFNPKRIDPSDESDDDFLDSTQRPSTGQRNVKKRTRKKISRPHPLSKRRTRRYICAECGKAFGKPEKFKVHKCQDSSSSSGSLALDSNFRG